MELKITKERILEAASKCSTAKATLETLFPEVFEEEGKYAIQANINNAYYNDHLQRFCQGVGLCNWAMQIAERSAGGDDKFRSLFLAEDYEWVMKDGLYGGKVLIPYNRNNNG